MKKYKEQFENMMFKSKMLIAYHDLPIINEEQKEILENDYIFPMRASMKQKLTIKRHYFDMKFHKLSNEEKAFVWDNNYEKFFDNIDSTLIQKVKTDNDIEHIVDLDVNDAKISKKTEKYISEHYQSTAKDSTLLLSKVLNAEMGFNLVESVGVSKNKSYAVSDEAKKLYELHIK